jgi:uncharacterized membrane protein
VQLVEQETELFWNVARTSLGFVACAIAFALGWVLYRIAERVARSRGFDIARHRLTLQSVAALVGILAVGLTSYVLYPPIMMLLLLLRWVSNGSAQTH